MTAPEVLQWPDPRDHYIDRIRSMTLGEAVEYLRSERLLCACIGPYNCCINNYRQALLLQRAAHIAIELVGRRSAGGT